MVMRWRRWCTSAGFLKYNCKHGGVGGSAGGAGGSIFVFVFVWEGGWVSGWVRMCVCVCARVRVCVSERFRQWWLGDLGVVGVEEEEEEERFG